MEYDFTILFRLIKHKIKQSMHNSKSAEYLDKINKAFAQLNNPPHEIEIDSLLGYIRIFYSSIKQLPIDDSLPIDAEKEISSIDPFEKKAEVNDLPPIIKPERETTQINESKEDLVEPPAEVESSVPSDEASNDSVVQKEAGPEIKPEELEIADEPQVPEEIGQVNDTHEDTLVIEDIPYVEIEAVSQQNQANAPDHIKKVSPPVEEQPFVRDNTTVEVPIIQTKAPVKEESMLTRIETQQNEPRYIPANERDFDTSDAVESIFRDKSPTGLVDFLGLSPLSDLNKAWGLNERMLIIKDLFGDDLNKFNQTIEAINKCTSFAEAKSWLIQNIVNQFKWTDLARYKKAINFVTQVKRLFVK